MKSLNQLTPPQGQQSSKVIPLLAPVAHAGPKNLDLSHLFRMTPIMTVLARVQDWKYAWPGTITCTLVLSIGSVQIATDRDHLPTEIEEGDWVVAKLMWARGVGSAGSTTARLLSATQVRLQKSDPRTSWWPTAVCERKAHLHRLRHLLSRLEPALQAIFMAVLAKKEVQHRFFNRIAALDHHLYPGGLFDQSVQAGEAVFRQKCLDPRRRQIAVLAALLYDIGKVSEDSILTDGPRLRLGMQAHALTTGHLHHALHHVDRHDPALVATFLDLLKGCSWTERLSPPAVPRNLKQHLHQALRQSWVVKPPRDVNPPGAAA